ncbi:acetyl xylan esterase [Lelliottia amnigena]|nr:acetyl xylan esterase [Lelliottia amnigena]ATG03620.1 acetyl xylan esterase [Lelliottia amnigena]
MQVHQQPQAAPELALARAAGVCKRMQNHAPYACMA